MTYVEVKPEFVIQKLGKGVEVVMCDFATRRMTNCSEMTVSAIQSFLTKTTVKFFEEVAATE